MVYFNKSKTLKAAKSYPTSAQEGTIAKYVYKSTRAKARNKLMQTLLFHIGQVGFISTFNRNIHNTSDYAHRLALVAYHTDDLSTPLSPFLYT